ncbi:MAG: 4,5-DOPA dioxygenase extradiol [Chloroflexota bacterium]|nr:4,5-DOPA dioxygenase extradiol [Chloroflexota bacterium]
MNLNPDKAALTFEETATKLPVLFVGHGSPMNTLEDNTYSRSWAELGQSLPRPKAILCISAHWETKGTQVTAMEQPRTIHDFGGFPRELFEYQYPAAGLPALAQLVQETVPQTQVSLDQRWGLDHGTWSVLARMYPAADIPVVQLSLDRTQEPAYHYALGKELAPLRNKGILIVGSGNIVHNLGLISFRQAAQAEDWALEFDETIKQLILLGDHEAIIHYEKLGRVALLSIPTNEHYLPLLYILALQSEQEQVSFFNEKIDLGSLSMRSVRIG